MFRKFGLWQRAVATVIRNIIFNKCKLKIHNRMKLKKKLTIHWRKYNPYAKMYI